MKDPIVEEVRKARSELSARFNNNLHSLCEFLRKEEKKRKFGVVSLPKRKTSPKAVKIR